MLSSDAFKTLLRYFVVGLVSNALGFLVYILLTRDIFEPKPAMSILYMVGMTISFVGNKIYVFKSSRNWHHSLIKFLIAHALGYVTNYAVLVFFVDILGYPHELVQGCAIFLVAMVLFVVFKKIVFPDKNRSS